MLVPRCPPYLRFHQSRRAGFVAELGFAAVESGTVAAEQLVQLDLDLDLELAAGELLLDLVMV